MIDNQQILKALGRAILQFDNIQQYLEPQSFWCTECDHKMVDSDRPETGKFFQVGGHVRKCRFQSHRPDTTEDHEIVIFAICTECLNK